MKAIRSILPMSVSKTVSKSVSVSLCLCGAISATGTLHAQAQAPTETPAPAPAPAPAQGETKPAAPADPAPAPTPTPTPAPADPAPAPAAPPQAAENLAMAAIIKKHAEECSDAQLKMDFARTLPFVPPKLVELMGGKDALKGRLAQANAELKRRGVTIDSAIVGAAQVPQNHGGVLVSLVPLTTRMTTPQGKVIANSHLIGVSENNGASWTFADTATVNEEKLGTLYPPLKGKITLPPATAEMAK
ncbi:hypothetical protein OKA05_28505 [Luteolibacter arcticus]|uniref:Uncharacterized protein n=1 Tax=Luteolibacter arcticus TaxID=1581411 RepID=A0ABT3GSR6_9BACT|nr:hypothetical protein [Luteolibacter arcticus]MCW1926527.1 hypothetical protein [Luteolibacter arcticus]